MRQSRPSGITGRRSIGYSLIDTSIGIFTDDNARVMEK
ncbi:hypothetical protein EMIT0111MI5_10290 [Burkholderia sp. IT-111MI5]